MRGQGEREGRGSRPFQNRALCFNGKWEAGGKGWGMRLGAWLGGWFIGVVAVGYACFRFVW